MQTLNHRFGTTKSLVTGWLSLTAQPRGLLDDADGASTTATVEGSPPCRNRFRRDLLMMLMMMMMPVDVIWRLEMKCCPAAARIWFCASVCVCVFFSVCLLFCETFCRPIVVRATATAAGGGRDGGVFRVAGFASPIARLATKYVFFQRTQRYIGSVRDSIQPEY